MTTQAEDLSAAITEAAEVWAKNVRLSSLEIATAIGKLTDALTKKPGHEVTNVFYPEPTEGRPMSTWTGTITGWSAGEYDEDGVFVRFPDGHIRVFIRPDDPDQAVPFARVTVTETGPAVTEADQ